MFGKNRNKKVGLCVMVVTASLVLAGLWAVLATPETALANKPPHNHGGDDGTAMVTISGPMQTDGPQTFPIKESDQTLELNRGIWTDQGVVPLKFDFVETVDAGNCICKEGKNWEDGVAYTPCDLEAHIDDSVSELIDFPERWQVKIVIDMSNLTVDNFSTTNKKGGHSIDITTDPDQTPTITGTNERLWIPEGPNKSGPVTVEWVSDTSDSDTRTRVFKFISNPEAFTALKVQVVSNPSGSEKKDKPRRIMRCNIDNADLPITVTVVTAL